MFSKFGPAQKQFNETKTNSEKTNPKTHRHLGETPAPVVDLFSMKSIDFSIQESVRVSQGDFSDFLESLKPKNQGGWE